MPQIYIAWFENPGFNRKYLC